LQVFPALLRCSDDLGLPPLSGDEACPLELLQILVEEFEVEVGSVDYSRLSAFAMRRMSADISMWLLLRVITFLLNIFLDLGF